jgi:hypothetical protein
VRALGCDKGVWDGHPAGVGERAESQQDSGQVKRGLSLGSRGRLLDANLEYLPPSLAERETVFAL